MTWFFLILGLILINLIFFLAGCLFCIVAQLNEQTQTGICYKVMNFLTTKLCGEDELKNDLTGENK